MNKQLESIQAQIKLLKKISRAAGTLGLSQLENDLGTVASTLTTDITIIGQSMSIKIKEQPKEKLFICDHADECTKGDGCPSLSPHSKRFCCDLKGGTMCKYVDDIVECIPYKG